MNENETIEKVDETLEQIEEIIEKRELRIELKIDEKKTQEAVKKLGETFSGIRASMENTVNGLKKTISSLAEHVNNTLPSLEKKMKEAFTVTNMEEHQIAVERFGEEFASALFSMSNNMSVLENAIVDSIAPLASVAVPIISEVLNAITALAHGVGQTMSGMVNDTVVMDSLTQGLTAMKPIAEWLLNDFLIPLAQWSGEAVVTTIQYLATALGGISTWIAENQALVLTMTGIAAGFAAVWSATDLVFFIDKIGGLPAILSAVTTAIQQCTVAKLASKAEDIAIIGLYVGDFVKAMALGAAQLATNTAGWIANAAAKAGSTAAEWAQIAATTAWTAICSAATAVTSAFGVAMSVLTSPITLVIAGVVALVAGIVLLVKNWDTVKQTAIHTWEAIKAAFGTAWSWFESKVLNPLVGGIKGGINGVIGFINGLIAAAVKGINSLIGMLNKLRFTVPDWVPGLGGETIGFSLSTVKAPQIPYLAKGAVLPANKPFLAMVGDQKHGTNVEAPLATIQEAVAMVLDEQLSTLMAGFNATVQEIRNLRGDVGNIRIGDAELYRAVERYREKRGVMLGTGW